jgi:hypothetical protein
MFRFTIRDVLWLTVVVAVGASLGMACWRDRLALGTAEQEMLTVRAAMDVLEADARDLGNMLDTFGDPMPQQRMDDLRQKYVERRPLSSQRTNNPQSPHKSID